MAMALYNIKLSNAYRSKFLPSNNLNKDAEFNLAQIDQITAGLKNKQEFIQNYVEPKLPYFKFIDVSLVKKKNRSVERKLIYDDSYTQDMATFVLEHQTSILDSKLVQDYCKRILAYLEEEEMYQSMVQCISIPAPLINEIKNYYRSKTASYLSALQEKEMIEIKEAIQKLMQSYSNFREVRLWELMYFKNVKEKIVLEQQLAVNYETPDLQVIHLEDEISNEYIKMLYEKYDGDIEMLIEVLGESRLEDLSDRDQELIGFKAYQRQLR